MKNQNIFKLLTLVILFGSCTPEETIKDPILDFTNTVNLKSKPLQSSDSLFKAETMMLIHDYLMVHDIEIGYVYKIFDVNKDRFLKRFGKIGEGPNELTLPVYINRVGKEGNRVGINEAFKQTFHEYSIDSIITYIDDSDRLLTTDKFDYDHVRVVNIDSNLFVGYGFYENPYTLISGNKIIENAGSFPFREQLKKFSPPTLVMAYQPRLFKNPKKPLVLSSATFSFNLDLLKVGENGKLEIYKSLHFWPTDFEDESSGNGASAAIKKENRFGNLSTTVSEKYIYVLYSDKSWEYEFPQKSNRILVYDWEGNSIRIINLDKEVNYIAAHEEDQYLIGYLDDGKANLFKFDFE
jgi:hypothetical protein